MNPTPYLTFQGNCREAMETYARIFDAKVEMMMEASEMPADVQTAPDKAAWIAHCTLTFDEGSLMASDDLGGDMSPMAGCSVHVALPSTERGREVFDALADGGTVRMDYQKTFWSSGFGTLTDRFGIHWMISCG